MAENNKKSVEISTENIEEVINNGATINKEIAEESAKKIAEQRKEKLTQRHIEVTLRNEYTLKVTHLSMKKTDKEKEIKLNHLKKITELSKKLTSGEVSLDDFDKENKEILKKARELMRGVNTWYDENLEKLYNQYPEARYSWRYESYQL